MRHLGTATVVLCLLASGAHADDEVSLYDRLWPELPGGARLTLSQQITDELTELGNTLGHHMGALSNEMVAVRFDGRRRRAKVRLGLANDGERFLVFRLDGDVHFTHGVARVTAKLDVGIAGRVVHLELPDFEMVPTSYRGDRGVEIRLPLFKRSF